MAKRTAKQPQPEIVRVLRILEYIGPRAWVEETVRRSIHGERVMPNGGRIRAVTLGLYPDILNEAKKKKGRKKKGRK